MNVGLSQPFGSTYHPWTMVAIRMLSLDRGLVYRELDEEARHLSGGVEKDKPLEVFPVFHAPPEGVGVVDLLLPYVGVATGLPVLKDTETVFSVNDVVSKAKLDESEAGPFKIETMSLAADDSSDTKQNERPTTVTVAGDVTFATDSDQLSAQADSVLASVVEQIKKYPSGGELTITGHTDDVADDAHNQDLLVLSTILSLRLPSPSRWCGQTSAGTASRLTCLQVIIFIRKSESLLASRTSRSSTRSASSSQRGGVWLMRGGSPRVWVAFGQRAWSSACSHRRLVPMTTSMSSISAPVSPLAPGCKGQPVGEPTLAPTPALDLTRGEPSPYQQLLSARVQQVILVPRSSMDRGKNPCPQQLAQSRTG